MAVNLKVRSGGSTGFQGRLKWGDGFRKVTDSFRDVSGAFQGASEIKTEGFKQFQRNFLTSSEKSLKPP